MKRICKSCGAKIPKNKSICKKCGEAYVDIETELELDEETKALVTVEKKSNMIHICILLLSILVFLYSLLLIYLHFTDKTITKELPQSEETSQTEEIPVETAPSAEYSAVNFIGKPFGEAKSVLGDQYSIKKVGDQTLACYINYPVTLTTNESPLNDNSIVVAATVTGNGSVTTQCTADMTYSQLRSLLNITKMELSPDKDDSSIYSFTHPFANDSISVTAKFIFATNDSETPCTEVVITSESLADNKKYGIVSGLDEGSTLNVRSEALYDAEALTQLYEGDEVEILDKAFTEDGAKWYQVRIGDITGYSIADFIEIKNNDNNTEENNNEDTSEEQDSEDDEESEDDID